MSSYSEYLSRQMQRTPKFVDTRPHRDAGHHTEVVKRAAAAAVQESKTPAVSQNMMLNGPTTRILSPYKKAHTVQDTSVYTEYTSGQAVAQSLANPKPAQIQDVCYSSTVVPEYNDRLRMDDQLALKQAAKNNLRNCCKLCGEPIQYTTACPCAASKQRFTTPS